MEFLAGISVGILIGLVAGVLLCERMRNIAPPLARETVRDDEDCPPPRERIALPYPYQPPLVVLAVPRERGVVSVERQTSALARR